MIIMYLLLSKKIDPFSEVEMIKCIFSVSISSLCIHICFTGSKLFARDLGLASKETYKKHYELVLFRASVVSVSRNSSCNEHSHNFKIDHLVQHWLVHIKFSLNDGFLEAIDDQICAVTI